MKVTFGLKPEGFNPENIKLSFLEAQRYGFDKAWLTDHLHETIMSEEYSLAEVWTTLSYLACMLDQMRLGICILNVNWRHPVLTAKSGAYLDILSGGKFELVLGIGLRGEEHINYGFPFGSPRTRIERCREFLEILKGLWASESFSYDGKFYKLNNAVVKPKPIQKPYPPLAVAASKKFFISSIPRWGAGWYTSRSITRGDSSRGYVLTGEDYATKVGWMNSSCLRLGVDPASVKRGLLLSIIIGDSEGELEKKIERSRVCSPIKHYRSMPLEVYRKFLLTGTPDEIRNVIEGYIGLGVTDFLVTFRDIEYDENDFQSVELFGREVIEPIKSKYC